ncbi:MAG: YdcF family protein [Leadbetterella sp.]
MKPLKKTFKILFILFTIWILGHSLFVTLDGLKDSHAKADLGLILGTKVNEDGTLSERLEKRLDCGLDLYKKGQIKRILVSGGLGKEGHWEGTKMKEYLIKNRVPDSSIIVDNFGNNTIASVNNTLKLKDSLQLKSVIVVSQYFHLTRSKMLFEVRGFENVSSASPWYFEIRDFYSILREFGAYYTQQNPNKK